MHACMHYSMHVSLHPTSWLYCMQYRHLHDLWSWVLLPHVLEVWLVGGKVLQMDMHMPAKSVILRILIWMGLALAARQLSRTSLPWHRQCRRCLRSGCRGCCVNSACVQDAEAVVVECGQHDVDEERALPMSSQRSMKRCLASGFVFLSSDQLRLGHGPATTSMTMTTYPRSSSCLRCDS
jgi:hypothetical protein